MEYDTWEKLVGNVSFLNVFRMLKEKDNAAKTYCGIEDMTLYLLHV